jgi:hypothetical protein
MTPLFSVEHDVRLQDIVRRQDDVNGHDKHEPARRALVLAEYLANMPGHSLMTWKGRWDHDDLAVVQLVPLVPSSVRPLLQFGEADPRIHGPHRPHFTSCLRDRCRVGLPAMPLYRDRTTQVLRSAGEASAANSAHSFILAK